jgi:surfactin synthase thioesterase subunit
VDKGGILVRQGQDLKSTQCDERLSTGALVEELKLVGERLHYKRLTGSGPDEGWVSLKVSGKDLLVPKVSRADPAEWLATLKAVHAAEPSSGNIKDAAPVLKPVGKAVPKARLRLLIFNWTGNRGGAGSAHQFLNWPKMLAAKSPPETWEVLSVDYPGRGTRMKEPNATEAKEIVVAVADALKKAGGAPATVLFGFSFGAILAYETAALLAARGETVLGLVVASAEHPAWPERKRGVGKDGGPTKDVKMEDFEKVLHDKGGTEVILQQPDMKRLFVPVIFSDMVMEEAYGASPPKHPPLPCPIVAFRGAACPQVSREDAEAWLSFSGCGEGAPTRVEEVATSLAPTAEAPWLSDWYLCQGGPSAEAMVAAIAKDFGGGS